MLSAGKVTMPLAESTGSLNRFMTSHLLADCLEKKISSGYNTHIEYGSIFTFYTL